MPEGTVFFPGEPVIRVEAPLAQAQWVETFLLASLGYPTLVASKAARIVHAAAGRPVSDFGARRGPGPQAGIDRGSFGLPGRVRSDEPRRGGHPARASPASGRWPIPGSSRSPPSPRRSRPTPATSRRRPRCWSTPTTPLGVLATPRRSSLRSRPSGSTAATSATSPARPARTSTATIGVVSGSWPRGDLDEWSIARLVASGAPIDAFGVGTEMVDEPRRSRAGDRLQAGRRRRGRADQAQSGQEDAIRWAKQVYRRRDAQGRFDSDRITRADEPAEGEPLLVPVIRARQARRPLPSLDSDPRALPRPARVPPRAASGAGRRAVLPVAYSAVAGGRGRSPGDRFLA